MFEQLLVRKKANQSIFEFNKIDVKLIVEICIFPKGPGPAIWAKIKNFIYSLFLVIKGRTIAFELVLDRK